MRSTAILADDSRGDEHGAPKSRSRRRARDAPRVFISFDTQTRECENTGGHTLAIGAFDIVTNLAQKRFLSRGGALRWWTPIQSSVSPKYAASVFNHRPNISISDVEDDKVSRFDFFSFIA